MLEINNAKIVEFCALSGFVIKSSQVHEYLRAEDDPELQACPDEVLVHFLDGLIVAKRGVDPTKARPPLELPVSNNLVIKKLRVAFQLQEADLMALMTAAGFTLGKPELSSILRKRDHRNYREAGDQILRYFLRGLTMRVRGEATPAAIS